MSIFDFFKKRKPKKPPFAKATEDNKKKEVKKPPKVKGVKKPEEKKPKKAKERKRKISKPKISGIGYKVLKSPHITEKATNLTKKNQYIFKVWPRANKDEIKKAIKEVFEVDTVSVQIIKIPKKRRRLGRISGWKPGYKKAIVKIKEGQKIEVIPR